MPVSCTRIQRAPVRHFERCRHRPVRGELEGVAQQARENLRELAPVAPHEGDRVGRRSRRGARCAPAAPWSPPRHRAAGSRGSKVSTCTSDRLTLEGRHLEQIVDQRRAGARWRRAPVRGRCRCETVSGPENSSCSSEMYPMTAVSGVRSSWVTLVEEFVLDPSRFDAPPDTAAPAPPWTP